MTNIKLPTKNFKRLLPYIGECFHFLPPHEIKMVRLIDICQVNLGTRLEWSAKIEYRMEEIGSYTMYEFFKFNKVAYERDVKLKSLGI